MMKHTQRTLTMLTLLIGLTLTAGVASAQGQSTSRRVVADIPFDFIVGDKTLPAGKYQVGAATSNGEGVRITSRTGKASAIRLSHPATDKSKNKNARMVFHRYGQRYFLAEIWSGDDFGQKLMPSKNERSLRLELGSKTSKSDVAKNTYETVEVVALLQ